MLSKATPARFAHCCQAQMAKYIVHLLVTQLVVMAVQGARAP